MARTKNMRRSKRLAAEAKNAKAPESPQSPEIPQPTENEETPANLQPPENEEAPENPEAEEVEENTGDSSRTVSDAHSDHTKFTKPMLPLEMYFKPSQYGKKIKLSTRCYVTEAVETLRTGLRHKLSPAELSWFEDHPQFSHFFHMPQAKNHKLNGIWLLFLRTAVTDKRREAWFVVNGVPIRYGIKEHALMSGLSCLSYPENYERLGGTEFKEKVFGARKAVKYPDVKAKLFQMKPSEDRMKVAVLYFLCSVIIGEAKTGAKATPVEPFFLRAVNDLELCRTFPWGRLSFDNNLKEIQHTMDHFDGEVSGTNWIYPSFCLPLEYLAFEAIPVLKKKFVEDVPHARKTCPRMCKMNFKKGNGLKGFPLSELNDGLGDTKVIDSLLVPYVEEEALMSEITEENEDEDVDDAVVHSWMKCLVEDRIQFCLDGMQGKQGAEDLSKEKGKEGAEDLSKEKGKEGAEDLSKEQSKEDAQDVEFNSSLYDHDGADGGKDKENEDLVEDEKDEGREKDLEQNTENAEEQNMDNEDQGDHEKDEVRDEITEQITENAEEVNKDVEQDLQKDLELYHGFVSSLFDDPKDVEDVEKVEKEGEDDDYEARVVLETDEPPRYGLRTRKPNQHLGPAKKRKT